MIRLSHLAALCGGLFLSSCAVDSSRVKAKPVVVVQAYASHAEFQALPSYPDTTESFRDEVLLRRTNSANSHIRISLGMQRGFLMNGDDVVIDYPVSTGKSSHPTPTGAYTIQEKVVDKRSNRYGKVVDASGAVVDGGADSRTASIPSGGKFVGAAMPYWMRLTWTGIGMHVGNVPRYPASHSCVRGQSHVMPVVYSKVRKGTRVTIEY